MKASLRDAASGLASQPDLRQWASGHLELPLHASRPEARAACLRKLAEYQWLPPAAIEESHEYWARLDGDKFFPSLFEQAFHDEEFRLRGQVEEFAGGFFALNPYLRQRRFQVLMDQCSWSANLKARLLGLAAGLELDPSGWEDAAPEEKELAQHVCQLFTLAPRERAQRRWALLQELEAPQEPWEPAMQRRHERNRIPVSKWELAARSLQDRYPDVAALEPILVDELAIGAARRQGKRARLPQVQPTATSWVSATSPNQAPANTGRSGGSNWYLWPVLFVLISAARFACKDGNHAPAPQFQPPNFQQEFKNQGNLQKRLDDLRQQHFKAQEELKKHLDNNWLVDPKTGEVKAVQNEEIMRLREQVKEAERNLKGLQQLPRNNGGRADPKAVPKQPAAEPRPEEPGGP